jgi:hypothetical protein
MWVHTNTPEYLSRDMLVTASRGIEQKSHAIAAIQRHVHLPQTNHPWQTSLQYLCSSGTETVRGFCAGSA